MKKKRDKEKIRLDNQLKAEALSDRSMYPQLKKRQCMKCGKIFKSRTYANRRCFKCHEQENRDRRTFYDGQY